jgi:xanthine dehydrogenase molybdenum-binding subunit
MSIAEHRKAQKVDPLANGALSDERLFMPDRAQFKTVGKGVPVKDAVEKVTGTLKYGVDFALPGMAFGKILRSPHAHARIVRIDTSKAKALPGVLGVITHEDAPKAIWENAWFNYRGKVLDGTARFVGDDMAAVAAVSEEVAEEALDLIEIEWELLPTVFNAEEARSTSAPQIREEGNERPPYVVQWGDVSEGASEADVIVECDVSFESQQYAPLGRNACVAEWSGDRVTVWTSSQTPSELRDGIHEALEIPLSKIRVMALPSGSSFGQWWAANFMLITVLLARHIRRPVKIELTNEECMATVKRRHRERTRGRMGARRDGTLTLAEFDHIIDNGGYGFKDDVGFFCVDMWGRAHNGHYAIHGVNTNLLTAGCMRGVGDVTLGSAVERTANRLAEKLGIDPITFRLINQIRPGEPLRMQHSRAYMKGSLDQYLAGIPEERRQRWPQLFRLSSGSTEELLKKGAEAFRWSERWKGWGVPHTISGPRRRAVGVGTGAHVCGVEFEGSTSAVVRINPDGSAKVYASCGRQGQGSETTLSQVASEALGIPFAQVEIETGDTDSCPWSHGSLASNTMFRIGWAVQAAALDARRQLLEIAASEFFEASPQDLYVEDGVVHIAGGGVPGVPISDVLNHFRSHDTLGQTSSITGRPAEPMPPSTTFARHFAAHFAEVEVDTETGEIKLLDYLASQDSGTVVNPQVLKNQAIGGAICGAGFALYEQLVFDANGRILNANLLDYKLLRCADFPYQAKVLFGDSYDPVGPFGARGAGEAPIAAADSAIQQAVYNAIGVWVDMPMIPERVLAALGKI